MVKAAQSREKDRADVAATLPLLDDAARGWLRDAVARFDPTHEWATTL